MMKKVYRVRDGLVVPLNENKIYVAGESVELSHAEFMRHAHQVETEEQYQARLKSQKSEVKSQK